VTGPWLFRMRWLDLLFAHWPVDVAALETLLPAGLELDTFEGRAWLGIVPFTMADVAPRGLPAVPRFSTFAEINVRTYVRRRGEAGIYFLSLDAASRPTVEGARRVFHLPYFRAEMTARRSAEAIDYRTARHDRRGPPAAFTARYGPVGPPIAATGLDDWLTRRMQLFAADRRGRIWRTPIAHPDWPLQPAEAEIERNTMAAAHGLTLPDEPPRLLFSRRLDVRAWAPARG
jgi:uncharacterized protein YqjF (DUF2071 family)